MLEHTASQLKLSLFNALSAIEGELAASSEDKPSGQTEESMHTMCWMCVAADLATANTMMFLWQQLCSRKDSR
eukprot:6199496-Pleurochrysis_carterae.AAC.4